MMSKTSTNFIQEVSNNFSVFVVRRGNYLCTVDGRNALLITTPVHFRNLQEGVEVEMLFRPMSECEALKSALKSETSDE